jgi:hypothetical protein
MEVTLKEAATLCKKSEKTLRRKIEAGLLDGRKEPMDFGGFMWMIDVESLDDLYPGSRPSNLPQVYDSPEPPQVRLKNRPEPEIKSQAMVAKLEGRSDEDYGDEIVDSDDDNDEEWDVRQSFFDYILDENRSLKGELKDRDSRIIALNERAFVLERALGEQEGTSATQARVLEWFQSQESAREKSRQENEEKLLTEGPVQTKPGPNPWAAALAGAGVVLTVMVILVYTGMIGV